MSANIPLLVGDSGSGGSAGLVPAPAAGDAAAGRVLMADGTWYMPPLATTSVAGRVKPDGTTVTVTSDGTISAVPGMANPMTAQGDLIVGGASGAPTRVAAGSAGQVWTAHGAGAAPTWEAPTGGVQGIIITGQFPLMMPNAQTGTGLNWQNYSLLTRLAGPELWYIPSAWKIKFKIAIGAPVIGGMVVLKTAAGSTTVLGSTTVTLAGSFAPTLSGPGVYFTDAIGVALDVAHDWYFIIFFANVSSNSTVQVVQGGPNYTPTGFVVGDARAVATIPAFGGGNQPYCIVGAYPA